jgi:pentatricopeptide repeat protein
MNHYRVRKYQNQFVENVKLAIQKGEELLKTDSDPWVHFYVGAAYGYQAFNRFRKHEWIGAYLDSKKGVNHLKETLTLDKNVYDVYLAFGTYHYWRTAKSKFLRFIAFWIPDKRELGLRQLQFSVDHGQYSPFEASYALIAAYFDYGKYEEAYALLNRTIEKKIQPSLTDLYLTSRLFIKFERWQEAEDLLVDLVGRLESSKYPSVGYQVECKYWIAFILKAQKKTNEALTISEQALVQSEKRNPDLEVESTFENFQDIKNQLKTLVRELS